MVIVFLVRFLLSFCWEIESLLTELLFFVVSLDVVVFLFIDSGDELDGCCRLVDGDGRDEVLFVFF